MKIFVTGARGFIGSAVCRLAVARGHEVLGLARRWEPPSAGLGGLVVGSLEEFPWPRLDAFGPEAVLHLAWTTTPGINFDSPENQILAAQSALLFQGLAERGVRHLAGTGTFIEYATSPVPLVEDVSPLTPLNSYARAKAETLRQLRATAEATGASWSWFRVFNAYGEGEARARMMSAMMLKLAAGEPAVVRTPASLRDYVQVADVAHGMLRTLEQSLTGPVNIGTGTGVRVYDLAVEIADAVGADMSLVQALHPPAEDIMPVAIAENSKLRTTGWEPQVPLKEGLARLWESLQGNRSAGLGPPRRIRPSPGKSRGS